MTVSALFFLVHIFSTRTLAAVINFRRGFQWRILSSRCEHCHCLGKFSTFLVVFFMMDEELSENQE